MTGDEVESYDAATTLATKIMALEWKARKDWSVEDQAWRHGELREMIAASLPPVLDLEKVEKALEGVLGLCRPGGERTPARAIVENARSVLSDLRKARAGA